MHLSDWKSPAKATVAAKKVTNQVEERPLVFLRLSQRFATNSLNSAPATSSGHDCATPSGRQHMDHQNRFSLFYAIRREFHSRETTVEPVTSKNRARSKAKPIRGPIAMMLSGNSERG